MIKFQKPIRLNSATLSPYHALVSLIATMYMKWRMNSMVRRQVRKRSAYENTSRAASGIGRRNCGLCQMCIYLRLSYLDLLATKSHYR